MREEGSDKHEGETETTNKMADDSMSEDQWLYGDSNPDLDNKRTENNNETPPDGNENHTENDGELTSKEAEVNGELNDSENPQEPGELPPDQDEDESNREISEPPAGDEEKGDEEDEEDDSDDDNVHVTIGDIKTAPSYPNLIKRAPGADKLKSQPGKFSIEEFESIGTINGAPAHEFSIDALEEKPWRKPGADITDYFNYGFNEETWRAYCERQKQMRMHESGVGLGGLGVSSRTGTGALPVVNDNSKYSTIGLGGLRKAGPPPGPRRSGIIDVIGGSGVASRRTTDSPPKENAIQVMTADKRDYGRKNFDMSVPPPMFDSAPPIPPPVVPNYPPQYPPDFYNADVDTYYQQAYEPAQELQWNNQGWSSRRRNKEEPLSPSHRRSSPNSHSYRSKPSRYRRSSSLPKEPPMQDNVSIKQEPLDKSSRERERERDRHKDRHRHHSRSRSGDRSERRSRKHKSRSRSPSHRSHKKKKSKKSDRSKDGSD